MKDYTLEERHKILIEQLKKHPATESLAIDIQKRTTSEDWKNMDTNNINRGVALLATFWHLTGGSIGDMNLYELLQSYMTDKDARKRINAAIN